MIFPVYEISGAIPLRNHDYLPYLLNAVAAANQRIWASAFIVDARVAADPFLTVRWLIRNLTYAKWRNVDVRVIVGRSEQTPEINVADLTSARFMSESGLDVRIFDAPDVESLHSKYVILDQDTVVIGSHNWAHPAFYEYTEDSIVLKSDSLAHILACEFLRVWDSSTEVE